MSLFVCPLAYLKNYITKIHQIFVHVACGPGSVLLWQCCDVLCISGLWIMLYFHTVGQWARIKHDIMFRRSLQGVDTSWTSRQLQCLVEFVRMRYWGEDCYLLLTCYTCSDSSRLSRQADHCQVTVSTRQISLVTGHSLYAMDDHSRFSKLANKIQRMSKF